MTIPARFGFPVFVFLNAEGNVIHIQDSSFLEQGNGYDTKKVVIRTLDIGADKQIDYFGLEHEGL